MQLEWLISGEDELIELLINYFLEDIPILNCIRTIEPQSLLKAGINKNDAVGGLNAFTFNSYDRTLDCSCCSVKIFPRIGTAVTSKSCTYEVRCGHGFESHLLSFLYIPC